MMVTILLCDDDLMNRKVASKILVKEGFYILEAQNGQEALDILKKNRVDLILMDLMMPVMDGFEATKRIKNDDELRAIPLIIISALCDQEAVIKGLEIGADEYLAKPFDLMDFRLKIKNTLLRFYGV